MAQIYSLADLDQEILVKLQLWISYVLHGLTKYRLIGSPCTDFS